MPATTNTVMSKYIARRRKDVSKISKTPPAPKHIFRNGMKLTLVDEASKGSTKVYMKPGATYHERSSVGQGHLLPLQRKADNEKSAASTVFEHLQEKNVSQETDNETPKPRRILPALGQENRLQHPLSLRKAPMNTFKVELTGSSWKAFNFRTEFFDFTDGGKLTGDEMVECDDTCLCRKTCYCQTPLWVKTRLSCDGSVKQWTIHVNPNNEASYRKVGKHSIYLFPCEKPSCTKCEGNWLSYAPQYDGYNHWY